MNSRVSTTSTDGSDTSDMSFSTSHKNPDDYEPLQDEKKYVYIIREVNTSSYKIGISNNPKKRLQDLQTGNPTKLIYKRIVKCEDAKKVEKLMHDKIVEKKIGEQMKGGGCEWYEVPIDNKEDLYDLLKKLLASSLSESDIPKEIKSTIGSGINAKGK